MMFFRQLTQEDRICSVRSRVVSLKTVHGEINELSWWSKEITGQFIYIIYIKYWYLIYMSYILCQRSSAWHGNTSWLLRKVLYRLGNRWTDREGSNQTSTVVKNNQDTGSQLLKGKYKIIVSLKTDPSHRSLISVLFGTFLPTNGVKTIHMVEEVNDTTVSPVICLYP